MSHGYKYLSRVHGCAAREIFVLLILFSLSASFSFVKVDGDGRASWGSPAGGGAAQKSLILKVSLLR